jgi:hypothetical protein
VAKAPTKADIRREKEQGVKDFLTDKVNDLYQSNKAAGNRKLVDALAREQLFMSELGHALGRVFDEKLATPKVAKPKSKGKAQRILNLVLSDTHYGSNLDPREVGSSYGTVEEARRTASVCKQVADYKRQYRDETELYVHVLGDIIQGQLHDPRDGAPLAEQVARAMRILVQAVSYLAVEFPKGVTVFCATGNHGRSKARHHDRGVNQKWDSIETMVYVGLKEALLNCKNVKVIIPLSPHYTWKAFDQYGFASHGDTVLKPGYPNKAIQVESVTKQVNSINAAAGKSGEEYSLFVVGHVHTGSQTYLGSGATFMTNGCLIPPDSYALSIGIFETACGQWMFESVPGHIVGDSRFIAVSSACHDDKSLDAIIRPFTAI